MKKTAAKARRIGVRTRLLCIFLLSVLSPLVLFGILMFYSSNRELEKESFQTYTQMTKQIGVVFTEYISRVDMMTRSVDNTNMVPRYLRNETIALDFDNDSRHVLEQDALDSLELFARSTDGIYSLSAVSLDGRALSYVNQKFDRTLWDFDSDYFAPLRESTGNTVLLPARDSQYLFSPPVPVFTVASKHIDINTDEDVGIGGYTGYVIAECPVSKLAEFCGNVDMGPGSSLYILDEANRLVHASSPDTAHQAAISALAARREAQGKIRLNGETHIFVSSTLSDSGWTILATTSYKNLTARSSRLLNTFLVLCLVSMLIISTVTFAVSGSFTRPIRILQKAMKKAGNGDLTVRIEHHRTDEFGELNDGFNRLIDELRVLVQNISESRERENAAKYHMLQSQINPHFLYNTLDTIRMMAVLEDKDDIASALLHLSALFRYHVRESGKLVTVKEELEQTENYLYLQKLRHQEQLKILYRIDPAALAFKMPKILLQPLLENAFAHGFQDLERTKILTITVRKEAALICFSVHDNGRGMDARTLDALRLQLKQKMEDSRRGIGLSNVNERLRLYFSESCCLQVESQPGVGTVVSFSIPLLDEASALFRYDRRGDESGPKEEYPYG